MNVIDYGLSFIGSVGPKNAVRFWIESRTRIMDEKNGATEDYYQVGSCKGEATFAEKDLFLHPSYDFLTIFGPEDTVHFNRTAVFNREGYLSSSVYRQYTASSKAWGGNIYHLKQAQSVRRLETNGEIRQATHDGLPIVGQTEIWDDQTQMRAIIEYPIKTMNINDERDIYQVDTGPVVWPDLSQRHDRNIESISLAFVAFNVPHFADFVIEEPVVISENGRDICSVYHYSKIISLAATNTLFCLGNPSVG